MQHSLSLQTYVPPLIADWIKDQAQARSVSVSIVVRDHLVATWQREVDSGPLPPGTDPERHKVFVTVALDALLTSHPDETLRERTIAAYHRRLDKLGLIAPRASETGDEA